MACSDTSLLMSLQRLLEQERCVVSRTFAGVRFKIKRPMQRRFFLLAIIRYILIFPNAGIILWRDLSQIKVVISHVGAMCVFLTFGDTSQKNPIYLLIHNMLQICIAFCAVYSCIIEQNITCYQARSHRDINKRLSNTSIP